MKKNNLIILVIILMLITISTSLVLSRFINRPTEKKIIDPLSTVMESTDAISMDSLQNTLANIDQTITEINHERIDILRFGAVGNGKADDTEAIQKAINFAVDNRIGKIVFPSGTYKISRTLTVKNAENLILEGVEGAVLKKGSGKFEWLLFLENCNNFVIEHLSFRGATTQKGVDAIVWGEQGVKIESCSNVKVYDCQFHDFGDAALRITADDSIENESNPKSRYFWVMNNYFVNITQTTTTPYGSTYIYWMNNIYKDLRASMKFATRIDFGGHLYIKNNIIENSYRDGCEIVSYKNVYFEENEINNVASYALHLYTNDEAYETITRNNTYIRNNFIDKARYGIRFTNGYKDIGDPTPYENVVISGNTIKNIQEDSMIIRNGEFHDINISDNIIENAGRGLLLMISTTNAYPRENIFIEGNKFLDIIEYCLYIRTVGDSMRPITGCVINNNIGYANLFLKADKVGGGFFHSDYYITNNIFTGNSFIESSYFGSSIIKNNMVKAKKGIHAELTNSIVMDNVIEGLNSMDGSFDEMNNIWK